MSAEEEAALLGENTEAAAQQQQAEAADIIIIEPDSPPPPVVTRTRSGRVVRTPSALLGSHTAKTPARRPRRSTVKELPEDNVNADPEDEKHVENSESTEPESVLMTITTESRESKLTEEAPSCPEPAANTREPNAINSTETVRSPPAAMETLPACPDKTASTPAKKRKRSESEVKHQNPVIPLGKPKSGRVWKDRNKQRFSAMVQDKPLRSSWEKKMAAKRDKDLVKKYALQLKEDKAKEKEDKRKRREENLRRRAENERRGEVVQVIQNTTKIKRMKKKQLRKIEKRDTLALLQKSQPKMAKAKPKERPRKSQAKGETIS